MPRAGPVTCDAVMPGLMLVSEPKNDAEEDFDEAHVPAQHPPPRPQARFPSPHADQGRAIGDPVPPPQGPAASVGLIDRLRLRRDFERVRREGRSVRSGPISVRFVDDDRVDPPRVAFATPRKVGTAVMRNRVRRRLRAILRATELQPGLYLFRLAPGSGELDSTALSRHVDRTTRRLAEAAT